MESMMSQNKIVGLNHAKKKYQHLLFIGWIVGFSIENVFGFLHDKQVLPH